MMELLKAIMNLACTGFCVYGIVVMRKWHKSAVKVDELLEQLKEDAE